MTIESADLSVRFRHDMQDRAIAELHADVYYDTAAAFCQRGQVQLYTEAYGTPLWDPVTNAGRADVPTAEFWMGQARAKPEARSVHAHRPTHVHARLTRLGEPGRLGRSLQRTARSVTPGGSIPMP